MKVNVRDYTPPVPQDRTAAAARVATLTRLGDDVTAHAVKYPLLRTQALAIGSGCYAVARDLREALEAGESDDVVFGLNLRADVVEANAAEILTRESFSDHDERATGRTSAAESITP